MKKIWGGDVVRVGASAWAASGLPPVRPPGEVVAGSLSQTKRGAALAEIAAHDTSRLQDSEVAGGLESLAAAAGMLMRTRLRLACESAGRGLHTESGFGLVDWLVARSPDVDPSVVRDLSKLATGSREPVHAPVLDGVLSGSMSVARGACVLRSLQRIRAGVPTDLYAGAVEALAAVGCDPATDDAGVGRAVGELLRRCLPEKVHDDANKYRRALRDVHESNLADGSVKRLIMTFGDDADYEAVRAVLTSPLAAPASREEVDATGEEDRRTPGQRRYDALMTVISRGVAGSRGQPTTPKAMLAVTVDLEVLSHKLSEKAGLPGCGETMDGASVAADSIRRLACEADIIPMVLGGDGEILDQGVRRRLVTPGQRVNLARRDRCCTIPGCTVPATWCEAHHVIWWSRGGRSDLSNYALLCPRHHTWVHDRDLTATVTGRGVIWHLR
ncbi:MAG: DUF222 domain-containing protein [Ornithinimicrobium sp.]|uniref:HNH endonuclease signature motif containing protein n=1 Tax=Ornithinimicrobium sp. TaxID=1977084 RepID=UPI0026DEC42B|nr:HNH endonuclease signature motif containing protein [Ornithinimicrobium sp.]MDO5738809.1 DUF222 domain-containing protein [Ornithinimicrobium sp.]